MSITYDELMASVKGASPTLLQLVAAGPKGVMVRNPSTDIAFRVVYYSWEGVLEGIKIYAPRSKRPARTRIMGSSEISQYLGTLESVEEQEAA